MEIWKDVINYEGLYQVSNLGNIRSVNRNIKTKTGYRFYKGKILKPCKDGHGYLIVSLSKKNIIKTKKIHIMVCESFLNHKTCGFDLVVDHKDSNKDNNTLNNLQIVTQSLILQKKELKKADFLQELLRIKNVNLHTCQELQ